MSLWTVAPRLGLPGLGWALPVLVLVLTVYWACTRMNLSGGLSLMTVTGLLASPIMWPFYLLLALLPLSELMGTWLRRGSPRLELAAVAVVFGLLSISQAALVDLARNGWGPMVLLEPTLALLLLGVLVARSV